MKINDTVVIAKKGNILQIPVGTVGVVKGIENDLVLVELDYSGLKVVTLAKDDLSLKACRGDTVLVWDVGYSPVTRIFLARIDGALFPVIVVDKDSEEAYINGNKFGISVYSYYVLVK